LIFLKWTSKDTAITVKEAPEKATISVAGGSSPVPTLGDTVKKTVFDAPELSSVSFA
jgi:hypothetical protein